MTTPVTNSQIPKERLDAKMSADATLIPVGNHFSGATDAANVIPLNVPTDAQFLKLQALTANIRYRVDGETVSPNIGFQLAAGSDTLVPCAVSVIYIIGEGVGTYQGQFVR
jgi:hypothetical protein